MRIAMIGQKGIPLISDGGGIEKHVEELSTRLAERGHQVFVYIRPRFVVFSQKEYEEVKLIKIPSLPTKNLDTITHTFLTSLHVLFKKVDIIHYHGVGPATISWLPRLFKRKTQIIGTFHSQDKFHKKWGWFARIYLSFGEWAICRFPHKTIAVSHSLTKYCFRKFSRRAYYIPNGVVPKKVTDKAHLKKWGLRDNDYILTVARLIKHKGIHHLISAYQRLKNQSNKKYLPKLVIVGAPSFSSDYQEYLKKLAGQSQDIIFTGFQSGQALAQLFAHSYLYAHPSESEGLSITIMEAMSYGKCVLISDISENLEVIDHSGVAFKSSDVNDLAEKMISLINHPKLTQEIGRKGRQFIAKNFNWDKIVKATEKVYQNTNKSRN